MATYTIKTTDLLKGEINGVPLPTVMSMNPLVPIKPGAVGQFTQRE